MMSKISFWGLEHHQVSSSQQGSKESAAHSEDDDQVAALSNTRRHSLFARQLDIASRYGDNQDKKVGWRVQLAIVWDLEIG